jgi:Flp pilus assembly protein TadG
MKKLLLPLRDDRGAAVVEMAIALPLLVLFLWGIFQLGVAFQASAGMQHALGEGARLATVCQNPTAAGVCSTATNEQIEALINDKVFGTGIGNFEVGEVVEGADYKELSVTFTMPTNFLFFDGPNINLTQTKRVYVAS